MLRLSGVLVFTLLSACGPGAPELPPVDAAALPPAARGAIGEAQKRALVAPQDAQATLDFGLVLQAHGQLNAALACYERARALAPERFDVLYYSGFARAANGENEKAAADLRQALKSRPASLPVALKLAELTRDAALARDWAARHPQEPTAQYVLGRALSGPEAIAAYRRALELFPRYGAAQFALASAYRQAGDAARATETLRHYERDKTTVPPLDDPEGAALAELSTSGTGLLRRAARAAANGDTEQALALHLRAVAQEPGLVDAWINLISLYARRGQASEAEAAYEKAVALEPSRADAHYNYGVLCLGQQRWPAARAAFEKTVVLDPRQADAWLNLGSLAGQQGRLEEAAAAFQKAIDARPRFAAAWFHLGQLHALRRRGPAAREAFQHAREGAGAELAAAIDQELARLP